MSIWDDIGSFIGRAAGDAETAIGIGGKPPTPPQAKPIQATPQQNPTIPTQNFAAQAQARQQNQQAAQQAATDPTQNKPGASILHDITHNPVTNAAGAIGKFGGNVLGGMARQGEQIPTDITMSATNAIGKHLGIKPITPQNVPKTSELYRGVKAGATGNLKQVGNTVAQYAQFAPRAVTQLAESVRTRGAMTRQVDPNNILLGKQPIPSLQSSYRQVNKAQGTQQAVVNTGLTGVIDALAAKGGFDSVAKGADLIKNGKPLDQNGAINPSPAEAESPTETPLTDKNIKAGDSQGGQGSEQNPNISPHSGKQINPNALDKFKEPEPPDTSQMTQAEINARREAGVKDGYMLPGQGHSLAPNERQALIDKDPAQKTNNQTRPRPNV